ncbi:hypothetical protein GcC1_102003 [Golovinomyces cichoracearum]|uniref:Uncharacterized protein n=2 Tax=Golovinomyces cichoracearum TaxID=62708 RepID=A0A420I9X8_9PEZI|nr:hypothetical protein GcC1_102003 [Golovinomyces cichoracearum]
MSSTPGGRLRGLWNSWKSLKLPWRKRFLAGLDLHGNTFWEFRDTLSSHQHRMRRLVKYSQSVHHSDIQISPQWHQWLRHARADPPSLAEQSQDALRQEQLKFLAAAADARWESKSKLLDTKGFPPHQILTPFECRNSDGHPETSPKFATCENGKNFIKHEVDRESRLHLKSSDSTEKTLYPENPWKLAHARDSANEESQFKHWDANLDDSTRRSNVSCHRSNICTLSRTE